MGDETDKLKENFRLLGFCIIEIFLDAVLFFVMVSVTLILHALVQNLVVYFSAEKDSSFQIFLNVGTVLLMIGELAIVALFARSHLKNTSAS
jgi:hypothetical protein